MTGAATLPLLVEVGCEEIPARFLTQAALDLGTRLGNQLVEAGLTTEPEASPASLKGKGAANGVQVYFTPRRLTVHVPSVLKRQPDREERVLGPPVKAAFDAQGRPTRAAEGFAAKNGVAVADLARVATLKGEYLEARKAIQGRAALDVLNEILPGVVAGLSFPKTMHWEASGLRWVRPIRWLLALLGEGDSAQVVSFEVAGVKSANATYGHRLSGSAPIRVTGFEDYAARLHEATVEIDPEKRRVGASTRAKELLEDAGLNLIPDRELEDWIVNSTEWPVPILGGFEERFLSLPREILITVMRNHQHYFAVEDAGGQLAPRFVTVLNVPGDPEGRIRRGHERVLAARFRDAEFFWQADQKVTLARRYEEGWLGRVTYQEKLGTYADKVRRMLDLAPQVHRQLEVQKRISEPQGKATLRALQLCKCDLTTQMVQEFAELQGVVGGRYAEAQGEPEEVWQAIYDHYRPVSMDDALPRSLVGAAAALVDKMDSLAAGFAAGLDPKGSGDPFGLRRVGNGAVRLMAECGLEFDLSTLVQSAALLAPKPTGTTTSDVANRVLGFLEERLRYFLEFRDRLRADVIRAALAADWHYLVPKVRARAQGLAQVVGSEDFAQVCMAAKRSRNILAQAAQKGLSPAGVNLSRFVDGVERDLHEQCVAARSTVSKLDGLRDYRGAFEAMAKLRPYVDAFFERVMVMDDDVELRQNRLGIVDEVHRLFSSIADLSEIESAT